MKKTSSIAYILLITVILLFVAGCDNSVKPPAPAPGKVKAEVFTLVNGDYIKNEEAPLFDSYYVSGKNELVAVLQIKNTGSLVCDYELSVSAADLPESIDRESLKIYIAQFVIAPQLVTDAIKNGDFESHGYVNENDTVVSDGTVKVGGAAYVAVIVDLPDVCDEETGKEVAKAIKVSVSAEEHSTKIPEENND